MTREEAIRAYIDRPEHGLSVFTRIEDGPMFITFEHAAPDHEQALLSYKFAGKFCAEFNNVFRQSSVAEKAIDQNIVRICILL